MPRCGSRRRPTIGWTEGAGYASTYIPVYRAPGQPGCSAKESDCTGALMLPNDLDRLVDTLQKSDLFSADFPRRLRILHAEWAELGGEERTRVREPSSIAIRRVKNVWELVNAVDQLGKAKHTAAVPMLAELWANCALVPVREAAGRALLAIGTPEARRALVNLIEDSEHSSVHLAVAAVFDEDPAQAFDRLSHYFEPARVAQPGGAVIPDAILDTFAPSSFVGG